jgi:uncharacterized membrane protein
MKSDPTEREQHTRSSFTRRDLTSVLIIATAAIMLVLPIFLRGFPHGADIRYHYRWAYYFCEELREGVLYPRWLAGANRGYGSPVMFYYPPLTFYVVAAFNVVARNLLLAIKLSCGLSMMLSGVSMYVFTRPLLSRTASVAAAVLYMAIPYHFFDLWALNALGEYWSFVWIPLMFDAIRRLASSESWRASAYLALSYALLLLTHVPTSLIVVATLPVCVLTLTRDKRKLVQVAAGVALGVGISAVFLVSVLFETKYVHIDRILQNKYTDAFLFEDFRAVSLANLLSTADYRKAPGYLEEANLVAIGLALLLFAVSVILLAHWRSVRQDISRSALVQAMWLVAIISMLMTTRVTRPLWGSIQILQYLQSPVRWLVPATVATCVLTGIAFQTTAGARSRSVIYAVPLAIAIVFNIAISAHVATQRSADLEQLTNALLNKDVPEYAPLWWDEVFHEEFEHSSVVIEKGDAELSAIDDAGLKQSYVVRASTETTLKFRSVFFPGWVTRIDGKREDMRRSTEGNIELIVPPGEHLVTLRFEETGRHIKADAISVASILILAAMFYYTRRTPINRAEAAETSTVEKKLAELGGSDYRA